MNRNLRKISITLPPDLVDSIDYVIGRLGVSRSAFIAQVMGETVQLLVPILQKLPAEPSPADAVRYRGDSEAVVKTRLGVLKELSNDLLADE